MKAMAVAGFMETHKANGCLKNVTLKNQPNNTTNAIITTANA
jgi:hypothetical protein